MKIVKKKTGFFPLLLCVALVIGCICTPVYAQVLNVMDYGAAGDGQTNDTAAIQACVDAMKEEGGVVTFPKGEYIVSAPIQLYSNVQLSGIGKMSKLHSTMTGTDDAIFYGEGLSGVSVTDLGFTSIGQQTAAIALKGCSYVNISDLEVEGCAVVRLSASGSEEERQLCSDVFIKNINCDGKGAKTTAIDIKDTSHLVTTGHMINGYEAGISIVNTQINESFLENGFVVDYGHVAGTPVPEGSQSMINIVCSDSVFTNIDKTAILVDGAERASIGGHDIKKAGIGIEIKNPIYLSITNNVITDTTDASISVAGRGDGVNINANSIYNSADKSCLLRIESGEQLYENRTVNITANTFHNNGHNNGGDHARSYIQGGSVDVLSVNSNHFYNTYMDMATAPVRSTVINGNQMVFEGVYEQAITAIRAGKTGDRGQLMIQNNHITAADGTSGASVGILAVQDDAAYSAPSYLRNNSVRGFPVSIQTLANSTNPQVKPFFLIKGNYFGGIFLREEGHTQSSVVTLEENHSVQTGGHFPSTIPTEGKWDKGQIIYFDQPKPGEYVGAVCIAKGSPGIWKLFGQIEE